MNYIEGKRAIIITSRNLEKMKYNRESQECQFYNDLGMIVFNKSFGMHQTCFDYFAKCYYLEYSDLIYLSKIDETILIYIIGVDNRQYQLYCYLPQNISDIKLAGLNMLLN